MSVIGIDIDGTLATYGEWTAPDIIGAPNPNMVEVIKTLHEEGHTLCAWTCRADYVIGAWLETHDLSKYFSWINRSPYITDSMKQSFDVYIGDEAVSSISMDPDIILPKVRRLLKQGDLGLDNQHRDPSFSSHAPIPFLAGTGRMYIDMFEQAWRDAWTLAMPCGKPTALLTICSHAKPYSKSFIHSTIRKQLHDIRVLDSTMYAHISTAGIIPSDAEMTYPFNAYDHDGSQMTEEAKRYFSEITYKRIWDWLQLYSNDFEKVIFYLRGEGKTFNAAASAVADTAITNAVVIGADMNVLELPWAALPDVDDCLTSDKNLTRLCSAY